MEPPYEIESSPVTDNELVHWARVASVSAMVSFSIPTFMTGIELFAGMSVKSALWALFIGASLLTAIGGFMGWMGAKTRKSAYLLVNVAFGQRGASALNFFFSLSLIGWFGLNLDLFAASVNQVLFATLGQGIDDWIIEGLAGALMIGTTLVGFGAINRLSVLLVPIMVAVAIGLAHIATTQMTLVSFIDQQLPEGLSVSAGVSLIVGVIIIGAIILPDITRFSRQTSGGVHTAFWSYFVAQSLAMIIAGYAAVALLQNDILSLLLAMGIGSWVLIVIVAGSWILNSLNLYSARLATSASLNVDREKTITLALGALGTVAAFANILDYFIDFLSILTAIFVPVAGIVAMDFICFNRKAYFEQSSITQKVNWPAVVAWALGAFFAITAPLYSIPSLTSIAALDAIFASASLYFVLMRWRDKARHPSL